MKPHEALAVTEYRQTEMATLRALVPLELPDTPPEVRRIERVREAVRRYWIEHTPEQPKTKAVLRRPTTYASADTLTLEQWRRSREAEAVERGERGWRSYGPVEAPRQPSAGLDGPGQGDRT